MKEQSSSRWRVTSASVTGTHHQRTGQGCQDAHHYRHLENGILLIAVADGAGSARFAAESAQRSVEVACNWLEGSLSKELPVDPIAWQNLLVATFEVVHRSLQSYASENVNRLEDMATTLLVAVITDEWLVAAQVGDGALVVLRNSFAVDTDDVTVDLRPDHGESINETTFVTCSKYEERLHSVCIAVSDIKAVFALSDGATALSLEDATDTPHPPFFRSLYDFARQQGENLQRDLPAFLSSQRASMVSDDDKTLIIAVMNQHTTPQEGA